MNDTELTSEILRSLGFAPTSDQLNAVRTFVSFMYMPDRNAVMVMYGSAGTGKTSIASAMVKTLQRLGHNIVLLAPTGRAAKVFSLHSGMAACTIHRKIYRQDTFDGVDTPFKIADNRRRNTLFVVDEASMIANYSPSAAGLFGSGRLLDDLIKHVYSGADCRLMLIGDKAQLPPVGLSESPALNKKKLEEYGLQVVAANIDEVLRQSRDSGVLYNATVIRRMITSGAPVSQPHIRFEGFPDVHAITGAELIESLYDSYSKAGIDGTMVIVRSNKAANVYNQGIRNRILGREEELSTGDRLMVVKNNYYWTDKNSSSRGGAQSSLDREETNRPSFLANGDVAVVKKITGYQQLYGFRFADVRLQFPDYDDYEIDARIILDSLSSESPSLPRERQMLLFENVAEDYSHLKSKSLRMKAIRQDACYNALQVKFAYAVTCHKAQGGQWEHVYIDQGYISDEMLNQEYIHWLYTAFTRAASHLFLVNWPGTP